MENHWIKESSDCGSNYVDLFPELSTDQLEHLIEKVQSDNVAKDNNVSTELRLKGNELFNKNEMVKAMDFYTASLCFAENGTENVSFVYANRSSCFLALKKYESALMDIELAKQANYPERLLRKLHDRQAKCLQLMATDSESNQFKPMLSFPPHHRFNCLANVLDIAYNEQFGRFIVANAGINAIAIIFHTIMCIFIGFFHKF